MILAVFFIVKEPYVCARIGTARHGGQAPKRGVLVRLSEAGTGNIPVPVVKSRADASHWTERVGFEAGINEEVLRRYGRADGERKQAGGCEAGMRCLHVEARLPSGGSIRPDGVARPGALTRGTIGSAQNVSVDKCRGAHRLRSECVLRSGGLSRPPSGVAHCGDPKYQYKLISRARSHAPENNCSEARVKTTKNASNRFLCADHRARAS